MALTIDDALCAIVGRRVSIRAKHGITYNIQMRGLLCEPLRTGGFYSVQGGVGTWATFRAAAVRSVSGTVITVMDYEPIPKMLMQLRCALSASDRMKCIEIVDRLQIMLFSGQDKISG